MESVRAGPLVGVPGAVSPESPNPLLDGLRRCTGEGVLRALAAPREEARAALLHCMEADPRRDRQLDDVSGRYADLVAWLDFDLTALGPHLDGPGAHPDPGFAGHAVAMAVDVLIEVSRRGGPRGVVADGLLRRYVARGTVWTEALHGWVLAEPPAGALDGVADELSERFPGDPELRIALDDQLLHATWFTEGPLAHPRLAEATAGPRTIRLRVPDLPDVPEDPGLLSTTELLRLSARFPRVALPEPLAAEWTRRTGTEDLQILRETARGDPDPGAASRACLLLSERGEDVLEAIQRIRSLGLPGRFHLHLLRAEDHHRPDVALAFARREWNSTDRWRRGAAERLMGRHAETPDRAAVEIRLAEVLGTDEERLCACDMVDALVGIGGASERPSVERAFRDSRCSLARERAVRWLAAHPPGLEPFTARACLWDGADFVVAVGAEVVQLDLPGVRERLAELAESRSDEVRDAATARLVGGGTEGAGESPRRGIGNANS